MNNSPNDTPNRLQSVNESRVLHVAVCGDYFSFTHFLTVKSSFLLFQPQLLHIYTEKHTYNKPYYTEWLDDVHSLVHYVTIHDSNRNLCHQTDIPDTQKVISQAFLVPTAINIFVIGSIIFSLNERQNYFIMSKLSMNHIHVFIDEKPSQQILHYFNSLIYPVQIVTCSRTNINNSANLCQGQVCENKTLTPCFFLNKQVEPRDILSDNDGVTTLLRHLFYGQESAICPLKYSKEVIPKVGHYVSFNRKHLDFSFYLSILSLLYVVKVDCVFIHGNLSPSGPYWADLQRRSCVRWLYWPIINQGWGSNVRKYIAHQADFARAEIFVRYGGLHADPDLYFIRSLPSQIWNYETVIGLDAFRLAPGLQMLPETLGALINLGACFNKPGSRFFRLYQESQRNFYDRLWIYNSGVKPSHLYDRHPSLALLLPNLQAVCNSGKCYPAWVRNDEEFNDLVERPFCLLEQTYSFHFTHPNTVEYEQPQLLRQSPSLYARVASIILDRASVSLDHIESLEILAKKY